VSQFELRRADHHDADAITDVWLKSRRAAVAHIPTLVHSDSEVHAWVSQHVLVQGECWVARTQSGEIIAMLALDGTWIEQLYVSPDHQRSGVGSALVGLAKRRMPGRVQLWTFQTNVPAQRFYERHGFVCAERTNGSGNEERLPDMRYVFDLIAA
jgi:ribosomal protein S18 acetylase RimI-like enzyme